MGLGRRGLASVCLIALAGIVLALAPASQAQEGGLRNAPQGLASQVLPEALEASAKLDASLVDATGRVSVVVRLTQGPAGRAAHQRAQRRVVNQQQDEVIAAVKAIDPSAVVTGRTRMVLNAVMFEVDAAALDRLAADQRVQAIERVVNFELDLSETLPYIGATPAVQDQGFRGKGVKVAVLDSGIDYTHAAFGGPGTVAGYEAAYGTSTSDPRNTTRDGLFPTTRVVEGYDFVGEIWPLGPNGFADADLRPDPDPIDLEGHGTHVADIIGGALGVAPEVDLYAVKVCSAVSSSCSGTAILQGIEFSVDPNGDGDTSDHLDIINMSLGAPYGLNYADSLSIAVDNATALGTLTVASAGNSADKPYIVGTPSAARTALSVAQTTVPRDKVFPIAAGTFSTFGVAQPWAPEPSGLISGQLVYGASLGNALGCTPYPAGSLTGSVLLVDRGTCAVSIKGSNGAAAGAVAVIVADNTAGAVPPSFGFGGGTPTVPTLSITQAAGLSLRGQAGQTATVDGTNAQSVLGSVVGTSSRGPTLGQMFYGNSLMYGQIIKPEIGAPGASISAVAGSGTGVEPFGGTSGAAPVVAGAAALLHNATNQRLSPLELKARLMNTGETNILNGPAAFGIGLAPITRIGGGEVRVDRALASQISVWESVSRGGAISFGFVDASKDKTTLTRRLVVRNYSHKRITLTISNSFRFSDDAANGAVSARIPGSVVVPAHGQRTVVVRLTIDGAKLRQWAMNSGSQGANPDLLTTFEYDGYIRFSDASGNSANVVNVPWQVLPRLSGDVRGPESVSVRGSPDYTNNGVGPAYINTYSLLGTSPAQPTPGAGSESSLLDLKAVGYATYNATGLCPAPAGGVSNYLIEFAINTHARQTHGFTPGQIGVELDTNRDSAVDFIVINRDFSFNNITDGRTVSWVINARTGGATAFFFAEHQFESANWILRACASQFTDATRPGGALLAPEIGQPVDATVFSFDFYNGSDAGDEITGITFAPGGERYIGLIDDIPPGGKAPLTIIDTGSTTNPTETGLILYLTGARAGGVSSGAPDGRESLIVTVR